MLTEDNTPDPTIVKIAKGAEALRDCATSIRARLQGREQTLVRLQTELSALRSISEITILKPPPPPPPRKVPPPQTPAHPAAPSVESILADLLHSNPVVAETAVEQPVVEQPVAAEPAAEPLFTEKNFIDKPFVDVPISEQTLVEPPASRPKTIVPAVPIYSRPAMPPVASSSPTIKTPRSRLVMILPIACLVIITALLAFSRFQSVKPTAAVKTEAPPPPDRMPPLPPLDEKSAEALAIVRQSRMAGDEKTLFMRLGGVIQHPGGIPAWSVEKLDEGSYLVIYREAAGTPVYAFETKLKAKTVLPRRKPPSGSC